MRLVKRLVVFAVSLAYDGLGTLRCAVTRLLGGRRLWHEPVVLTYHTICKGDLASFDAHMKELKRRASTVFADTRVAPNGRPTVAVTFDDAFESIFEGPLSVLAKYRIPATVFVPTGYLGAEPGWKVTPGTTNRPMGCVASAQTIARADKRLVRFGSHTVTHPKLGTLPAEKIEQELTASRRMLQDIVGEDVRTISLPYGSCSPLVLEAAARAGYEQVFANVPVAANGGSLLRGRVNASPHDWPIEFALKARGAYGWLGGAIRAKRALLGTRGRSGAHDVVDE